MAVTRNLPSYRPMPIFFNENGHYDFHLSDNNFTAALSSYAGRGLLDMGKAVGEKVFDVYNEGFQRVLANWRINTPRRRAFFEFLA